MFDSYICRQYGFSYRPQFVWSLICLQTGLSYYCLVSLPTFGGELQYPWLIFLVNYFCLTTFGGSGSHMSADRPFLLLSYFTPHLWQQASIPIISFFITSLVSCLSRQTILTTVLFHSPPSAESSNTHD